MRQPEGIVSFVVFELPNATSAMEFDPSNTRKVFEKINSIAIKLASKFNGFQVQEASAESSLVYAFSRCSSAIEFAVEAQLQYLLKDDDWPQVKARCAIVTEEAVLHDETESYTEDIVNHYLAFKDAAHPSQILVSEPTYLLVRERQFEEIAFHELGSIHLDDLSHGQRVYQVTHPDLPDSFPTPTGISRPANSIPSGLTRFVGRDEDIQAVRERFYMSRLVTLTGPGGVGKTRLAIQTATEMLPDHADGAWFVDLTPVRDSDGIWVTLYKGLLLTESNGRPTEEVVCDHLMARECLLVVDNCEHVIKTAADIIQTLISRSRNLQVLATSREPLRILGETPYQVQPFPAVAKSDFSDLEELPSVKMFVDRASVADPTFDPTPEELRTIAEICDLVDGLPLALELVSVRATEVSIDQLRKEVGNKFRLTRTKSRSKIARQKTIRAAVEWSYDLLSPNERVLFARLSVFASSFSVEAACEVCAGAPLEPSQIPEIIETLAGKSMILAVGDQPDRFRLLETMRQFGTEQLSEDDYVALKHKHLLWVVNFVESTCREVNKVADFDWVNVVESEHHNLDSALYWVTEGADQASSDLPLPSLAYRLAYAAYDYWFVRGYFQDGCRWGLAIINRFNRRLTDFQRAKLYNLAGILASYSEQREDAEAHFQRAWEIAVALHDQDIQFSILINRSINLNYLGQIEESLRLSGKAEELAIIIGSEDKILVSRSNTAATQADSGDPAVGLELALNTLAENSQVSLHATMNFHLTAASALVRLGRYSEVSEHAEKCIQFALKNKDLRFLGLAVMTETLCAGGLGLYHRCAILLGIHKNLRNRNLHPLSAKMRELLDACTLEVQKQLGEPKFWREFRRGETMSLKEIGQLVSFSAN